MGRYVSDYYFVYIILVCAVAVLVLTLCHYHLMSNEQPTTASAPASFNIKQKSSELKCHPPFAESKGRIERRKYAPHSLRQPSEEGGDYASIYKTALPSRRSCPTLSTHLRRPSLIPKQLMRAIRDKSPKMLPKKRNRQFAVGELKNDFGR